MGLPKWRQDCREIHRDLTRMAEEEGAERSDDGKLLVGRKRVKLAIEDRIGADRRTVKKYMDLLRERGYLLSGVNQHNFRLAPLPGDVQLENFDIRHPERAVQVIEEVETK